MDERIFILELDQIRENAKYSESHKHVGDGPIIGMSPLDPMW